jgi:aspartyl-tRNA(Asn)/glutamyl-tRNA(Gln) amidotransferase subunit A
MCNIVWFKPSYGRNSRYWVIPMASSLDCPGTLTKTVRDAWILYEIMNGEDVLENTSIAGKDTINPIIWEKKDLKWLKVGLPREYFEEWIDKWVKNVILEAVEKMKELWAEIIDISLPMTKYAIATYYIIVPAEVSTNLGRLDGLRYGYSSEKPYANMNDFYLHNRGEGFWEEAQRWSILWAYVLSAGFYDSYYKKAWQIRTLIRNDFQKAFEIVDVIVSPVSPNVAWKIGEKIDDPLKNYLADAYTIPASLAWLPGISVPAWFAQSEDAEKEFLPVWLQILAPQFSDQKVLEVAHIYEQATQFWKKNPPWFED